ncbi:hypothetical protein AB0B50_27755 [Streptomyces sp. NPDC041068]|uniref:hypothetical protein n=1 Tax=Streptomyces sp. NPDC041068 TaxID=3155130 RepID=UPI0033E26598
MTSVVSWRWQYPQLHAYGKEVKAMDGEVTTAEAFVLDDVDALIDQLETQFDDAQLLKVGTMGTTQGCTKVGGCTGSCPCTQ